MNKTGIFTGGNDRFIDLIIDLVDSIRSINKEVKIYVLNDNLSLENINKINQRDVIIINYNKFDHLFKNKNNINSKINILRLRLNDIAVEKKLDIDNIIWLDADTWVQNNDIFEISKILCKKKKLGIVSQNSRYSQRSIQTQRVFGDFHLIKNILYKNSRKLPLSFENKEKLKAMATLNSGVFCLPTHSTIWKNFQKWQNYIIKHSVKLFFSDQLAIGMSVYIDRINYECLPDTCNYMMGSYKNRWNTNTKKFTEYYPPYNEISVLHYCGLKKFTDNWNVLSVEDQNDNSFKKNILFSNINKELNK